MSCQISWEDNVPVLQKVDVYNPTRVLGKITTLQRFFSPHMLFVSFEEFCMFPFLYFM